MRRRCSVDHSYNGRDGKEEKMSQIRGRCCNTSLSVTVKGLTFVRDSVFSISSAPSRRLTIIAFIIPSADK